MFFSKPKPVQCFAFEDGVLYIQSAQKLAPGKSYTMQAELPVGEGEGSPLSVRLKAVVTQVLESTPLFAKRCEKCFGEVASCFYSTQVQSPAEVIPHLQQLLDGLPQPQELRTAPRVEKRLRATSPQLPGFRGTVVDLSETGLGLLIDGPMQKGQRFRLLLDLEDQRIGRLDLHCLVCWCRPEPGAPFRAGIQFEAMPLEQQRTLRQAVLHLLKQERGVIHDASYLRG